MTNEAELEKRLDPLARRIEELAVRVGQDVGPLERRVDQLEARINGLEGKRPEGPIVMRPSQRQEPKPQKPPETRTPGSPGVTRPKPS